MTETHTPPGSNVDKPRPQPRRPRRWGRMFAVVGAYLVCGCVLNFAVAVGVSVAVNRYGHSGARFVIEGPKPPAEWLWPPPASQQWHFQSALPRSRPSVGGAGRRFGSN